MTNNIEKEIKLVSQLSGVNVKVRDICHDWILITFDIPKTKEGDKIRQKFYKVASRIGAIIHTESCYLLPWCPETEDVIIDISSIGNCFVWLSTIKDDGMAKEITLQYDSGVYEYVKVIEERIKKMEGHLQSNRYNHFTKMLPKTHKLIAQLNKIATARGSVELLHKSTELLHKVDNLKRPQPKSIDDLAARYVVR